MISKIESFHDEYRFLSNFWPVLLEYEGIVYPTIEHAFQAAKTLDNNQRTEMSQMNTADAAKRFGRQVTLRPDWEQVKFSVMRQLVAKKFMVTNELGQKLIATGDAVLIDGNNWGDVIWGVCNGEGKNMLGVILMERRNQLKELAKNENKGVTHG